MSVLGVPLACRVLHATLGYRCSAARFFPEMIAYCLSMACCAFRMHRAMHVPVCGSVPLSGIAGRGMPWDGVAHVARVARVRRAHLRL